MPRDGAAARLLAALAGGDDLALAGALHRDVRALVDTGDERGGEFDGRAHVGRVLRELVAGHPDASLLTVHVNGDTGLALRRGSGEVVGVLGIDVDADGAIARLWVSMAPPKLAHWNRRRPDAE